MRDRRRRDVVSWSRCFCYIFPFLLFSGLVFSSFRLFFRGTFQPVLGPTRPTHQSIKSISDDSPHLPAISIRETVVFPDQTLFFLNYPPSARLFTKEDLDCVYLSANSSQPQLKRPPARIDGHDVDDQIVRCPAGPPGSTVSLGLKSRVHVPVGPTHRWDSLAYEALIDRDNTTIVFAKGLNLRPESVSDASRFECVYGWDFERTKFLLRSEVISIAQEIVRCKTPLSVLGNPQRLNNPVKVSVRVKGRGTLHSIATPWLRMGHDPPTRKAHEMCLCTMVRNQAKFLREWVMYHARIGVQRWFIYDNNSEDDIYNVIKSLVHAERKNISRHVWPWIKTQEGGFAHCELRARELCEWVGFIDVDEFFRLPSELSLHDVLRNASESDNVGEIRISCYSFGPSGLKHVPQQGVMVGYTCRTAATERHKSIVRPEALNSTLINVVHHFHLSNGFEYMNVDRGVLVINHYKYQVWEVFKEKFYRRVATYVADWQDEQNVGSKDRAPGLGTRAVEPPDWSTRFCEVNDTGLRDQVLERFANPQTHLLPWQDDQVSGTSLIDPENKIKMAREEPKQSPQDSKRVTNPVGNGQNMECLFTPRFKSVAAMAGWDEEALIIASLVVDDTPDRESKHKKRSDIHFTSPPTTNSRRAQRRCPISVPVIHLNLDDEKTAGDESNEEKIKPIPAVDKQKMTKLDELSAQNFTNSTLPCMDKLKEELSCAICLEICYEPSTTPCGHSFCKKCLRSAADKCGKKCPKCRQLIGNGRSCTVNTVLWNTIQLLFPQEVKARNAAAALNGREAESESSRRGHHNNARNENMRPSLVSTLRLETENPVRLASRDVSMRRRRRVILSQDDDDDAALALRLQREEFIEAFRGEQSRSSLSLARANLRAMASRAAINISTRRHP
ncbi:Glyco_transf_92 domain-containing protein/zf-C3HC4_2 domain-containing protein, partial [Cephalotus follicularis]